MEEFERDHPPYVVMYSKLQIDEYASLLHMHFSQVSLLSGARNARNSSLAEQMNHRIRELFPDFKRCLVSASVLLANTLASSGELDKASSVRWTLSQSGEREEAGLSWTIVNGQLVVNNHHLHQFYE